VVRFITPASRSDYDKNKRGNRYSLSSYASWLWCPNSTSDNASFLKYAGKLQSVLALARDVQFTPEWNPISLNLVALSAGVYCGIFTKRHKENAEERLLMFS